MKRFLMTLAIALMCAMPAFADTTISFSNVSYPGTFQGWSPGGVIVGTQYGTMTVPTTVASIRVGGVTLTYAQMQTIPVGTPVVVALPPCQGPIYTSTPNVIVVQQQPGVYVPVPYAVLPTYTQQQFVYVRKHNGKVVRVPLNAAMNMQRAQGAVIMGSGPVYSPTQINVDYDNDDHGHDNGHGKGKHR